MAIYRWTNPLHALAPDKWHVGMDFFDFRSRDSAWFWECDNTGSTIGHMLARMLLQHPRTRDDVEIPWLN